MARRNVVGVVVRCSVDGRTAYVRQSVRLPHPKYGKVIARNNTYCVETHGLPCIAGRTVNIMEVPPVSKTKRWAIVRPAAI